MLLTPAGILYQGLYSQNLVGAHVEMRSLQVTLLLEVMLVHCCSAKLMAL